MKKHQPIHHYLFGIFPLLFLYAHNADQTPVGEITVPLLVVIGLTVCASLLLRLLTRDPHRRALIISVFFVLVFSYGHVAGMLPYLRMELFGQDIRREEVLFLLWCLVLAYAGRRILRSSDGVQRVTGAINIVAIILVSVQVAAGGYSLLAQPAAPQPPALAHGRVSKDMRLPDIYYIILDGYGRADMLERMYQYDNSPFIDYLRETGFYVADSSHANYCQTLLSLATSLNVNYLDSMVELDRLSDDRRTVFDLFQHNRVFATLKNYGYTIVSIATGYSFTELPTADFYLKPGMTLNEYENVLLATTPLPLVMRLGKTQFDLHRERIEYILDKLPRIREGSSPRFVFAHIMAPHPPFVYGKDGTPVERDRRYSIGDGSAYYQEGGTRKEYISGYRYQVAHLNRQLQIIIDDLLAATSADPPIIILQGDHGPRSGLDWDDPSTTNLAEQFGILNAYFLPGKLETPLYASITPVNSFRLVFNAYLASNLELLRDEIYYSALDHPFDMHRMADPANLPPPPDTLE